MSLLVQRRIKLPLSAPLKMTPQRAADLRKIFELRSNGGLHEIAYVRPPKFSAMVDLIVSMTMKVVSLQPLREEDSVKNEIRR